MKNILASLFCLLHMLLPANDARCEDTTYVKMLLRQSKEIANTEPQKALNISLKAREIAEKIADNKGLANALKQVGIIYYKQQKYPEALDYWNQSIDIYERIKDDVGVSNLLNNIAAVYKDQGVDDKALEFSLKALQIAERTGDKFRIMTSLITTASIYHNKRDPKALDYLMKATGVVEKEALAVLYGNIGEVYNDLAISIENNPDSITAAKEYYAKSISYYNQSLGVDNNAISAAYAYNGIGRILVKEGKFLQAIESFRKAFMISQKLDDKWNRFKAYQGMGNAHLRMSNTKTAIDHFNEALKYAEEVKNTDIAELYNDISNAYRNTGDYKMALAYNAKYAEMQKEIYNTEVEKQLGRLQLNFDLYKKDGEVVLLTKEKKIERQAKMGFAVGLLLIMVIAVILYRNYKVKVKTNIILDKQKVEIEGLLLNILPAEVAKELQQSGKATPKHYEHVSVLFTDFKGFTTIADKMSPGDLVEQLNTCFMAFDEIVEKYGLEKIKTIGDAYMCAGGIPSYDSDHPHKIVRAALEMQEWVFANNESRKLLGMETWDIRLGIHIGPLVAGVVGKKKYAYDIWGSTVNIASRMESNSEPGRVNISSSTYAAIKDQWECSYRGKIHAKNVGDIEMYFVEREKPKVNVVNQKEFQQTIWTNNAGLEQPADEVI